MRRILLALILSNGRRSKAGFSARSTISTSSLPPIRASVTGLSLLVIVIFLVFTSLIVHSTAIAATRYVDNTNLRCSDSGQGTREAPYCTINKAAAVAVAGDIVIVASGIYTERVTVKNSGTSTAPITFTVADGGKVTVTGKRYGFYLSSRSWVTIDGFNVSDTDDAGIYLISSSNITISNCHISQAGLTSAGYTANGIYLNSTVDSVLSRNTVDYNSDAGIALFNGSTRIRITGNIAAHNARGYIRAAPGIDVRSGSNTIDSNICHDNEDSGIQLYTTVPTNNFIVNNLCFNNGDHGIDISRPTNSKVIGNTVYNNVTAGINVEGGATGTTLANNISIDNGINSPRTVGNIRVDSASISGTTIDYDLVYLSRPSTMIAWKGKNYSSLSAFVAATGQETHGLEADPLWVAPAIGDFHLQDGSPAIDSANSGVTGAGNVDLEGSLRVDDPATADTGAGSRTSDDRGSYEYQPFPDLTPPTVSITNPTEAASVSGTIPVSAAARDNVGVVGVQFKIDGNNLGREVNFGTNSTFWDTTTAGNGVHSLTAVARDSAGNTVTSVAVNVTVNNPIPLTFITTADAYINANSPTKNYGTGNTLWAQDPGYQFLMKFTVSGVGSRLVTSAILRLYAVNLSDRGGDFYRVTSNDWSETGITWNNVPSMDPAALASLGPVASYNWAEVDVTSLITGDGIFSFRVVSPSTDSAGYASREVSGFSPQLIIYVQ